MTYVVTESCIKCKYMDCVPVCPVHCFHEGANMLVIDPATCIDCDECRPACPAKAIKPDSAPGVEKWLKLNADFVKRWPNITKKKNPPVDADKWAGVADKFKKYFDPEPAKA
jgi:ferredoxin